MAERSWPVKFDTKGVVRAIRNPLGRTYKLQVKKADKDGHRYVAEASDAGRKVWTSSLEKNAIGPRETTTWFNNAVLSAPTPLSLLCRKKIG